MRKQSTLLVNKKQFSDLLVSTTVLLETGMLLQQKQALAYPGNSEQVYGGIIVNM